MALPCADASRTSDRAAVVPPVLAQAITNKNEIVYGRIIPAMGVMLFLGNSFYAWQAIRMKNKNGGREFTAQPYGLNTVGGFPFVFGIALSVYLSATPDLCADTVDMVADGAVEACENAKFEMAWEVTVASNFLTGLLNILAGIAGYAPLAPAPASRFPIHVQT